MIDKATAQKIKDTADIVEVVSDYVHLTRRGSNYMGLCPFHNERTPSFSVNKSRNYCYCFSCHRGGSPVNFIMEKEGISYHDALLHLAKKYGIKVEERELTDQEREAQSRREAMFIANEWAMNHFEHNLTETQDGKDIGLQYLYGRGVTQEAIKQFHLGYALDQGSAFLDAARKKGFNIDVLKTLGLVGTSQQGREYDRFRGRVIFPILNSSGKVVAFGGRDLKGGPAKYINSPESDLYKKSNELYGMYQARSAIVKEDKIILPIGQEEIKAKKAEKLAQKTVKILEKTNSKKIVLSKQISKQEEYTNFLHSYGAKTIEGKWLFKALTLKVLDYIVEKKRLKKEELQIAILINEIEPNMLENIKEIVKQYKRVNIVTNHFEKFKKIEQQIFDEYGIMITVTNNKKRSLAKSQIILNVDFPKELINKIKEKYIKNDICIFAIFFKHCKHFTTTGSVHAKIAGM